MFSANIHNPTIHYFHKILAHTLFRREETITFVSRDELFILFCASRSRQVNAVTFMLTNLNRITDDTHEPIIVGGLITMIVDAISLRYPLARINPLGGIRPMSHHFCFNRGIIRNLSPNEFEFMINNEVIQLFTLPNHERTSVHNQDNWLYKLEGQNESPSPPGTPQIYDNFDASLSDVASFTLAAHVTPPTDYTAEINALPTEVASLIGEFTTLRVDFHEFMDVANDKFDQIFQQIYSIQRCFEPNIRSHSG